MCAWSPIYKRFQNGTNYSKCPYSIKDSKMIPRKMSKTFAVSIKYQVKKEKKEATRKSNKIVRLQRPIHVPSDLRNIS